MMPRNDGITHRPSVVKRHPGGGANGARGPPDRYVMFSRQRQTTSQAVTVKRRHKGSAARMSSLAAVYAAPTHASLSCTCK